MIIIDLTDRCERIIVNLSNHVCENGLLQSDSVSSFYKTIIVTIWNSEGYWKSCVYIMSLTHIHLFLTQLIYYESGVWVWEGNKIENASSKMFANYEYIITLRRWRYSNIGNSQFMWADLNEPRDLTEPMILKTNNLVRFSKYKMAYNISRK